ncbi:sulfite exporter TauE/SafE family protein [Psychromonas sp. SR45-3]|uniref:sulfite exporter TauE/SafE family protein n=1 Tax=Psychromonas sp. SR45-3 TaxID=2760930 RepID=UPI0015FB005B|nr:sulfite exporter TauE/SafE family protein [Psychromonas sp. SR45-3]MBB1274671.1 sulfite exporter TauE/SafE family protein [Psychromonas sp. SR45-3]
MLINDFFSAFLIGILGAGHCIGMCSGIASALSFSISPTQKNGLLSLLLYNLGRISSYSLAGFIFAASSSVLIIWMGGKESLIYLRIFAAIMMLLLAFYIARLWNGLLIVERAGQFIWRFIKPLAQYFLPLKHPILAFPLGFFWGWLPCGLVYSTLVWAISTADAFNGLLIMLGFGLGTLPAMMLVGTLSHRLKTILNKQWFRYSSGLILALFALQTLYIAFKQLS